MSNFTVQKILFHNTGFTNQYIENNGFQTICYTYQYFSNKHLLNCYQLFYCCDFVHAYTKSLFLSQKTSVSSYVAVPFIVLIINRTSSVDKRTGLTRHLRVLFPSTSARPSHEPKPRRQKMISMFNDALSRGSGHDSPSDVSCSPQHVTPTQTHLALRRNNVTHLGRVCTGSNTPRPCTLYTCIHGQEFVLYQPSSSSWEDNDMNYSAYLWKRVKQPQKISVFPMYLLLVPTSFF